MVTFSRAGQYPSASKTKSQIVEFEKQKKESYKKLIPILQTVCANNEVIRATQVAEKEGNKKSSNQININGNVSGSTIIIGNANKVNNPQKKV